MIISESVQVVDGGIIRIEQKIGPVVIAGLDAASLTLQLNLSRSQALRMAGERGTAGHPHWQLNSGQYHQGLNLHLVRSEALSEQIHQALASVTESVTVPEAYKFDVYDSPERPGETVAQWLGVGPGLAAEVGIRLYFPSVIADTAVVAEFFWRAGEGSGDVYSTERDGWLNVAWSNMNAWYTALQQRVIRIRPALAA